MPEYSLRFPASADEILDRRAQILAQLLHTDKLFGDIPVKGIAPETLEAMLRLYDELFFDHALRDAYGKLSVTISGRLLSAAGQFIYAKNAARRTSKAEIRMSSDFLFRLSYGSYTLNGLTVMTPQEAFLLIFEHELIHALETALYGKTDHGKRFMMLAGRFFGHTAATHHLPTRKLEAAQHGIRVGARCSFVYQEKTLSGQITYVGKTATVMVQSATGEYRDSRGLRYTKYRVPLSQLKLK